MSQAFNVDGKALNVNNHVSIIGIIVSVSAFASGVSWVTVQPPLANTPFQANVDDIRTFPDASCGPSFGNNPVVGKDCTTMGVCTAVSGNGLAANVTVTLAASGSSVVVPAGACHSTTA